MEPDHTESIATDYGERWIGQQAEFGQEALQPVSEDKIYCTLVDPFSRTRMVMVSYIKEYLRWYKGDERINIRNVFEEQFLYWTKVHCKSLPTSLISNF